MNEMVLATLERVPVKLRGFVRDIRIRWALEEAGLYYRVEAVARGSRRTEHLLRQPFGQVPWLIDGNFSVFETGAILLHIGERSSTLLPSGEKGRSEAIQWLFAALNSVEMHSAPWATVMFSSDESSGAVLRHLEESLKPRLERLEIFLNDRAWLTEGFSIADIAMADVLRLADHFDALAGYPACRQYVGRAMERPCFQKAYADQIAHFSAAD